DEVIRECKMEEAEIHVIISDFLRYVGDFYKETVQKIRELHETSDTEDIGPLFELQKQLEFAMKKVASVSHGTRELINEIISEEMKKISEEKRKSDESLNKKLSNYKEREAVGQKLLEEFT